MAATMLNEGKVPMWNQALAASAVSLLVRLYSNNVAIDATKVLADFTQAAFPGYGDEPYSPGAGTALDGNNNAQGPGVMYTFTCSGGGGAESIYGYVIYDSISGKGVWAEANPNGPVTIVNDGDTYSVTLTLYVGALPAPF